MEKTVRRCGAAVAWTILVLGVAIAGCYRAHERVGRIDAGPDAPSRSLVDVAPPPRDGRVGARDANILPPDPEPDGSIDLPPDAWRQDGATPRRVVLELDGDPIALDDSDADPGARGGRPMLVWNGSGWGAGWLGVDGLRLRLLDQDGVPLGPSRQLVHVGWPPSATLEFAIGRYAVVTAQAPDSRLQLFDRAMSPASPAVPLAPAQHGDVARLEAAHEWIVATRDRDAPYAIVVAAIGDYLRESSPRITLQVDRGDGVEADGPVVVAALKTRAVVAWVASQSVQAAVFTGAPLTQASPIFDIAPFGAVHDREDLGLRVRPVGDHIALAAPDGSNVVTFSIDPWMATSRGPSLVGPTRIIDRSPGIAPMPEHATYGVCWARGQGAAGGSSDRTNGVSLSVFDENGAPLSDILPVVSDLANIGGVDCGWNGTEFVILWWRAGEENELFSQRVRARFD